MEKANEFQMWMCFFLWLVFYAIPFATAVLTVVMVPLLILWHKRNPRPPV